ncbi:MAG: hypothetical protein KJ709_06150 [Nanoarchaeota archaeon]|nr:hypothetical protein [Nanoarchaeota archaeon]
MGLSADARVFLAANPVAMEVLKLLNPDGSNILCNMNGTNVVAAPFYGYFPRRTTPRINGDQAVEILDQLCSHQVALLDVEPFGYAEMPNQAHIYALNGELQTDPDPAEMIYRQFKPNPEARKELLEEIALIEQLD